MPNCDLSRGVTERLAMFLGDVGVFAALLFSIVSSAQDHDVH